MKSFTRAYSPAEVLQRMVQQGASEPADGAPVALLSGASGLERLLDKPTIQKVWSWARQPYRAASPLGGGWRYFDSVEACLDHLRERHPGLALTGCHFIAFTREALDGMGVEGTAVDDEPQRPPERARPTGG